MVKWNKSCPVRKWVTWKVKVTSADIPSHHHHRKKGKEADTRLVSQTAVYLLAKHQTGHY